MSESKKAVKPKGIIRRKAAKDLFNIIIQELAADDNLNERTVLLVDSMALLEQLKHQHLDDIKERGVVEFFKQGAQELYRDNKSVDKILKIVEQQRRLLAELKLTPASEKKVVEAVETDDFEDF